MGYNEDQAIPMQFKMELDEENENDDEEIDQVVPTTHLNESISCEDSTLDVIVLYVN